MSKILCLGHLCADVITKPVDTLPERGKLLPVAEISLHTGGCGQNCSMALAKLGMDVGIMGKIGKDGFGDFILQRLSDVGVDTRGLIQDAQHPTSASVVLSESTGERSFLHCYGANVYFTESDVDERILRECKFLVINAAFLMKGIDGKPMGRILKRAQELGIFTVLDTAWDPTGSWMETIAPCLPHLDIFIPSMEEAEQLTQKTDVEDMADVFFAGGCKTAVIKMGKDGCFVKNKQEKFTTPAFIVDAVDTTGAGDSFVAGFVAGLSLGYDLKKAAVLANAVGAHCVLGVGASSGIKALDEVIKFIEDRNGEF